jgi:hypothetical protein
MCDGSDVLVEPAAGRGAASLLTYLSAYLCWLSTSLASLASLGSLGSLASRLSTSVASSLSRL